MPCGATKTLFKFDSFAYWILHNTNQRLEMTPPLGISHVNPSCSRSKQTWEFWRKKPRSLSLKSLFQNSYISSLLSCEIRFTFFSKAKKSSPHPFRHQFCGSKGAFLLALIRWHLPETDQNVNDRVCGITPNYSFQKTGRVAHFLNAGNDAVLLWWVRQSFIFPFSRSWIQVVSNGKEDCMSL